jgi:hypothetical protein
MKVYFASILVGSRFVYVLAPKLVLQENEELLSFYIGSKN